MNDEKSMESLEELVKCPICCDNFKEPRSLPCSHVFCLGCLQRQEESEPTKFIKTCPICRQEIDPEKKVSAFPPAFIVQQMVERMHHIRTACSQDDRCRMVDVILNLYKTREQLKKDEESRLKQDILAKKGDITRRVDETVEKIKQYIDYQRQLFLDSINAECEIRLEKLNQYSQDAERNCKVKSWLLSNIDDNFSIVTSPKPVLSTKVTSLALEPEGNRAVDEFLSSLDINSIRRDISDKSQGNHFEETEECSFRGEGDAPNARNGVAEGPVDSTDHQDAASSWDYLCSVQSCTPRVNIPDECADFPANITRSELSDDNTLSSESVLNLDSNNVVSVTPYIVKNEGVDREVFNLNDSGANGSDYSARESADIFPGISGVTIEHWGKASSHQSQSSNTGDQLPGLPQQRKRISSAPTNITEPPEFPKPFGRHVRSISNDPEDKSVSGTWKSLKRPMILTTNVVQDMAPSKMLYVHVTSNYTSIAVEGGTKMWVFMNAGAYGRRRFIFDAVVEKETQPAIIGIASLPDDNGWCMLLKNTILVFNYHGVLSLTRSFPDTNFLSALVHSSDQFVFIDEDFNIGIAGFSLDNVDEVKFLRPSGLQLTGVILAMATGPNMLFIAHADPKRNVGTISCLSGFASDSLVLCNDHEIHAPCGFDFPQSICCNQNGTLFALWREKYHRKSVIVEYLIDGNVVISNIAFDKADRVRAITCSSEGRLVTCSI